MNPCYWTIEGPTSVSPTDGSTVYPCRTICGNGFLDIEEECERIDVGSTEQYLANNSICINPTWSSSLFGDKPSTTAPGDLTSKVYCSESCQCKDGWEINPSFNRAAPLSEANLPCRKVCNNGVLDPNEECEAPLHNDRGTVDIVCSSSCQCLPGFEINPAFN